MREEGENTTKRVREGGEEVEEGKREAGREKDNKGWIKRQRHRQEQKKESHACVHRYNIW